MVDEPGALASDVSRAQQMLSSAAFPSDVLAQVRELAGRGNKIEAIKLVRQYTNWGLKESKEYVEALQAGASMVYVHTDMSTHPAGGLSLVEQDQVRELAARGEKIEAIKLVRQSTGWGLKESKDYVESLQTGVGPSHELPVGIELDQVP
ncbi:MAG: ribosomal protein L7/L12 [Thermoflexales bacterium]|nr:ribosomal protein L7/L12 [Thermoflexales bacterium]